MKTALLDRSSPAPLVRPSDRVRNHRCSVCDNLLSLQQVHRGICSERACREAYFRRRIREDREAQDALLREEATLRREAVQALAHMADPPEACPIAIVPYNTFPLKALPDERRQTFRQYLTEVISKATMGDTDDPPKTTVAHRADTVLSDGGKMAQAACATCGGDCCQGGGDHAYLNTESIQQRLAEQPDHDAETLLEFYISHLPDITYADSCVFHAETGCVLPRHMRGNTCNEFLCHGLRRFQEELRLDRAGQAFVAATDHGEIRRCALVDANGLRECSDA